MNIRLLHRDEIEKERWNGCVHYAPNGNIFGYMWYLDHVAKDWCGLVEDEYHSVFPLVYRTDRLGRGSLVQPVWMREMGIYSVRALSPKRIRAFLEAIPDPYKKVDIAVGATNRPPDDMGFQVGKQANYYLDLGYPYEELADRFSSELFAQLNRAQEEELLPVSSIKPERIAGFFAGQTHTHSPDQHALLRIMYNALHRGWGFASAVKDRDDQILAADFFVYSHGRVMSLLGDAVGPRSGSPAWAFLYQLLIHSHAGRPIVLDFNSPHAGFSGSFGAREYPYLQLQRNDRWLGLW
jgi:hypothetical protein